LELPTILKEENLSQIFTGTVLCTMGYIMVSDWRNNGNEQVVSA